MNPRTYRKMLKINERLAEYSQTTRIIELLPNQVTLNNGTILIENDANRFVNRVMNKKIVEWVMNIDKLLSGDVLESTIKSIAFSVGGKAVQRKHGDRLAQNLNTGVPWNAGTKNTNIGKFGHRTQDTKDKISKKNSGANNGMFGKKMSADEKKMRSDIMKAKILQGEFTPNSNNRNTHWESMFDNKKYRSSWEALYQCINPLAEYEVLRIKYNIDGVAKIYIVDFVDHVNKVVVEIKPKELCVGATFIAKIEALNDWANANGYNVLVVNRHWFKQHTISDTDLAKFDESTKTKIKGLYEINKKN